MATCTKCGKDNRSEAKYCRFCGEKFEVQISETSLIGKQNIEPELEKLEQKLKVAKILAQGPKNLQIWQIRFQQAQQRNLAAESL